MPSDPSTNEPTTNQSTSTRDRSTNENASATAAADDPFAPEMAANAVYAEQFALAGLEPIAASGLAVVTCMDSRIEPLEMLGLVAGDAKILRNAGARVTDDVLRTLVLAVHLLGVRRILVVPHLKCRMSAESEDLVHKAIFEASGIDTRSLELRPSPDARGALRGDLQRLRSSPYIPADVAVGGAIYDVDTGRLERVV